MRILIKNTRIVDGISVSSPTDVLIEDGLIRQIGQIDPKEQADEVLDEAGSHLSSGWLDIGTHVCDPGMEHREDLTSAAAAAAIGGFTGIAAMPNEVQCAHSKSEIQYVRAKARGLATRVHPLGAVSLGLAGKDLAELFDMHHAGAVAFSDADHAIQDAGLLLRSLQYAKAFDGLVFDTPFHKNIAAGGQMHEGLNSTMLGLKGIPVLAETLQVQRDLSLLQYADGRLHLHLISTAESVELIRRAKAQNLRVTCSVAMANLCFTDEKLLDFDSNWKVRPPLRSQTDREALVAGVNDGTIDVICSNHCPWDEECKNLEFPYAEFGMSSLETFYSLYVEHLSNAIPLPRFVECVALAPRKTLGLAESPIREGEKADLTLFSPDATWDFVETRSKSKNSPLLGCSLKGKVLRTFWSE
jgi:dihydroorotase